MNDNNSSEQIRAVALTSRECEALLTSLEYSADRLRNASPGAPAEQRASTLALLDQIATKLRETR
jgi:hypothetical protein